MLHTRALAASPTIDVRLGHRVTSITLPDDAADDDSIKVSIATLDNNTLPKDDTATHHPNNRSCYTIKTKYIVAADGAHSIIRKSFDVPMLGPGAIQHLINIHFISPDLGKALAGREGMLYFVFGPTAIAVVVAHDMKSGEFVAQVPYFPPLQSMADFTPEACVDVVRRAAGNKSLRVQVKTVKPWAMSGAVARPYSAGKERAFLVGDAAHVVPPSGAFGMNTSVQDAHNLAWKLALALKSKGLCREIGERDGIDGKKRSSSTGGGSAKTYLDTYEKERRPVAEANMRLSVANFHETLQVAKIMGLDYEMANSLSSMLSSDSASSWAPRALRRGFLDAAITVGKTASGAIAAARKRDLEKVFSHGETLRLQFPKEDLGFIYGENALIKCSSALLLLIMMMVVVCSNDIYKMYTL